MKPGRSLPGQSLPGRSRWNPNRGQLVVVRNDFGFYIKDQVVRIWFGTSGTGEDEYLGEFHISFLPAIIAGLTAMKQVLGSSKKP